MEKNSKHIMQKPL